MSPPASIQELADRAEKSGIWETSKDFKEWLKAAERARHAGQDNDRNNDYENAFVEYARAATLILDKVPSHREYYTRLDGDQRNTLVTKGKAILDRMGELKPVLIDRHNKWEAAQSSSSKSSRPDGKSSDTSHSPETKLRKPSRQGSTRPIPQGSGTQIWYPDAGVVAQEMRKREDAAGINSRNDQRTRLALEQAGIIQRQREADEQARAARQAAESYSYDAHTPFPRTDNSLTSSSSHSSSYTVPPLLPLESPAHDYSLAAEPESNLNDDLYKRVADLTLQRQQTSSPFDLLPQPPITTTSEPPPTIAAIQYPQIMSQHQRTQGYAPSLQSMFSYPAAPPQSSLLFDQVTPMPPASNDILPMPSYPSLPLPSVDRHAQAAARPYMFGPRDRPITPSTLTNDRSDTPRLVPPTSQDLRQSPSNSAVAPRIAAASSSEKKELSSGGLKTVRFPREVLPRFLSIASLNTAKNRETCGLLLGKLKNDKYVVTTLLIPRQRSTSDTCTMDEEELVLAFSEKRSLMTLGWIHTHPSQSCFMSSVDLHTHSGFQCMLPEAFAVVCAPQHTPNFGIFRLTDPPGLQTILTCKHKDVFHPHPDVPIYTDADKGHVQMKDMALEIVDLR